MTTYDGDRAVAEFMVRVNAPWDAATLEAELRRDIARAAAEGKTNTE